MKIIKFLVVFSASFNLFANGLSLSDAIQTALKNDVKYQQILLKIKQNNNAINSVNSPEINLSANLEKKDRFDDEIDNSIYSINFKQNLFNQNNNILTTNLDNKNNLLTKQLQQIRLKKKLEVIKSFFAVILADMDYQYLMEDLAVYAVGENRIKDYIELGKYSEVDLFDKSSKTQLALVKMRNAENIQLIARAKLATTMGLGIDEEITELINFKFDGYLDIDLKTFKFWQDKIITGNIDLQVMNAELKNLEQTLTMENNNYGLSIDLYGKIYHNEFESDKNGNYLAGLSFSMPLYNADNNTKQDNLVLDISAKKLAIKEYQNQILTTGLELWLKVKNLLIEQNSLKTLLTYKDLYLEKARANYELEQTSDIGNAMVEYTKTEKLIMQNKVDIILTMQQLLMLTGEDYVK